MMARLPKPHSRWLRTTPPSVLTDHRLFSLDRLCYINSYHVFHFQENNELRVACHFYSPLKRSKRCICMALSQTEANYELGWQSPQLVAIVSDNRISPKTATTKSFVFEALFAVVKNKHNLRSPWQPYFFCVNVSSRKKTAIKPKVVVFATLIALQQEKPLKSFVRAFCWEIIF